MVKILLISLLFFLNLLFPLFIFGQSYQTFSSEVERIKESSRWHIGPFLVYPRVQLSNIGYDNNVYIMREEDKPISDFTATISADLRIYLLFRNWLILSFSENPEYVYYFEEEREKSFNNNYSVGTKLLIFYRFALSGNYQSRKARRRATSEFDVRAVETVKSYDGSFFCETARRTSFGIFGSFRKISYEDITQPGAEIDLSRALNHEEKSGNFEFYYRIFSESQFFLSAGYTEYNFDYFESRWRDSYSYQTSSGIRFPLFGRIRGTLDLGYKKLIPRIKDKKRFSGLVGDTILNIKAGRFVFNLQYDRDCRFSYEANNIFFIENIYRGGISLYLTYFLRLDYNFYYGTGGYPEPVIVVSSEGQEVVTRKDIYRTHSAGLAFRIIRNTGIGLTVSYWERDSNIIGEVRNRKFIGAYVTYEF